MHNVTQDDELKTHKIGGPSDTIKSVTVTIGETPWLELIDRVLVTREGGAVSRCHTRQHIGEYTNGRHTYNAVSLLLLLWPQDHQGADPRMELVKALQWHDVQERFSGDVPAQFKRRYPAFGRELDHVELLEQERIGLFFSLNVEEWQWLKAVDLLEFYLWCTEQRALGNTIFQPDAARSKTLLLSSTRPNAVLDFVIRFEHHMLED